MALTLDEVAASLNEHGVSASLVKSIVDDLKKVIEENKGIPNPNKKKNQFFVVAQSNGDNTLKDKLQTAFLITAKEDYNPANFPADLERAKVAHNNSQKRKKNLINTFAEVFARCKAKFCKEANFGIKTKHPVQIIWF